MEAEATIYEISKADDKGYYVINPQKLGRPMGYDRRSPAIVCAGTLEDCLGYVATAFTLPANATKA